MECSQAAIFNRDVCNIVVTLVLNIRKTLASLLSVNIFLIYSLFYQVNALDLSSKVE